MSGGDCRIVFTPSGRRGDFAAGTSVLTAARALGVDLDTVCGGRGLCGRCQVQADGLSPPDADELGYAERRGLATGRRLGCRARLLHDVIVDVPPSSQVHRQVVRKPLEARDVQLDPPVRLHMVAVPPPTLGESRGDLERLRGALEAEWQLKDLRCAPAALADVRAACRFDRVTAAVRDGRQIIGAWPGFRERCLGLAIDVGSTTIAAHLCDMGNGAVLASAGMMNPQIRFGEDLMSRVSYAMLHDDGQRQLTEAVRGALGDLARECCGRASAQLADVMEVVLVGNPVMHHLLLGLDPRPLGQAPFTLALDEPVEVPATDVGLRLHSAARAYLLPCIAGHVGGDTAAVLLAEEPWNSDCVTLIVDVGTNAEIVLGDRRRLLAASSPTGPAFEGAQISCGQRAAPGAIERVRIDRQTLVPRFKVIGADAWSDEPDFADAIFDSGVTGVCGSGIIEAVAEMFLAGILDADGTLLADGASRSDRVEPDGRTFAYVLHEGPPRLRITQNDVRAIQLAKAALYAGARLLMEHFGVDHVERIRLAGAFGSHIDPCYAMVLGLIPDCDLAQVSAAGNAAGTGARIALLSRAARAEIEARVRQVEKVETAIEPRFQEHFVAAMALPHAADEFANLRRVVELPASRPRAATRGRRRRHD